MSIRLNSGYGVSLLSSLTFPTEIDGVRVTEVSGFHLGDGRSAGKSYKYVKGDAIKKICECAFQSVRLRTVEFPCCSYVDKSAFVECLNLQSVSFPRCTYIAYNGFGWCSSNSIINLPKCSYLGEGAFRGNGTSASALTVSIPRCEYIGDRAFLYCTTLSQISVPECKYIGALAFSTCALTTISLPKCSYIGVTAFWECEKLTDAYLLSTEMTRASVGAISSRGPFVFCTSLQNIYVPASLVDTYKADSVWSLHASLIKAYTGE